MCFKVTRTEHSVRQLVYSTIVKSSTPLTFNFVTVKQTVIADGHNIEIGKRFNPVVISNRYCCSS
jgi:hypothetical protein